MKELLEEVLEKKISYAVLMLESGFGIDLTIATPNFSEVFCTGCTIIDDGASIDFPVKSIPTYIELDTENNEKISFFHFIYLCKQWASSEGYPLQIELYSTDKNGYCAGCLIKNNGNDHYFNSSSEQLAVIEACKLIIKGKNDKDSIFYAFLNK